MTSRSLVRAVSAAIVAALLGAPVSPLSASPRRTKTRTATALTPTPPALAPTSATPPRPTPKPATLVPEPAWVGTPAAGERPYQAILRARQAGASDDELLARVAKENTRYSLSTPEIQQLRAAGVSTRVIEAMLRSGRTPVPTTTGSPGPQRGPRAAAPPTPPAVRKLEKH